MRLICSAFVLSEHFLPLAIAAHKFSQRPSAMIEIEDSALAVEFDLAAVVALLRWEERVTRARWSGGEADGTN
jgi:hypothetical protein